MAAAGGVSSDVTEGPVLSAVFAEFLATLLFLYVTVATVIGHKKQTGPCDGVGILGIAWSFGGMIFVLVYCTAGIAWSFDGMSFGAAVIYNNPQVWVQHWIFWVGPFVRAMAAAAYHK